MHIWRRERAHLGKVHGEESLHPAALGLFLPVAAVEGPEPAPGLILLPHISKQGAIWIHTQVFVSVQGVLDRTFETSPCNIEQVANALLSRAGTGVNAVGGGGFQHWC